MPNSYIEYSSSGTGANQLGQQVFSFSSIDFLNIADIKVKGWNGSIWQDVALLSSYGDSSPTDGRKASDKTLKLSAIPSFQKIRLYRQTTSNALVDFVDGARLTERDLDTAYKQGLFVAQEVSEDAGAVGSLTTLDDLTLGGTTTVDNLTATGTVSLPSSTDLSISDLTATGVVRIFNNPNANHFYRTGTWSPDITINGSSVVDIPNSNKDYTKIGRVVFISAHIVLSIGIPNGSFTITGLPFSVVSRGTMSMSVLDSSASFTAFDQIPTAAVDESGDDIVCDTAGISYGFNDRINLTGFYFTS